MDGGGQHGDNTNGAGIRVFDRPEQKRRPFCIQYRSGEPGRPRRRKTESFATEKGRAKRVKQLERQIAEEGRASLRVDAGDYRRLKALEERAGDLEAAVEFYLARRPGSGERIGEMVEDYVDRREAWMREGARRRDRPADTAETQIRVTRTRLGAFRAAFGDRAGDDVSVRECGDWLVSLARVYKPATVANYRREVSMFFAEMARQGRVAANPMAGTRPVDVPAEERAFYSAGEAARFFRANMGADPEIAGLVALSAFGSLRTSAVLRLRRGNFRSNPRALEIPATMQKKGRRFFVERMPEAFWRWAEWMPSSALGMGEQTYHRRRKKACARAGLARKDNGWRHACLSHLVALDGLEVAAEIAQHRNLALLWETYRGNVSARNAGWYFSVVPGAIRRELGKDGSGGAAAEGGEA